MPIRCPICGNDNRDSAKFCASCRSRLLPTTFLDPSTGRLVPGAILEDRYQITGVIGGGGMKVVYKAIDTKFTNRVCVVKEMLDRFKNDKERKEGISHFYEEAELLASFTHPNIPRTTDRFEQGGRYYLVMDFVDGKDLEKILANSPEPIDEKLAIKWCIEICDVLDYLHNLNPPRIYRDMKPSNIMINSQGKVMITDWDLAKVFQPGQKGTMMGTEGYAPPEQYRGETEPRSDIYALGATLHQLVTKRDPQQDAPFTFANYPARSLNPKLSPEIEAVISKAVSLDPNDRYSSAKEMKMALEAILNKSQMQTQTQPQPQQQQQQQKKKQTQQTQKPPQTIQTPTVKPKKKGNPWGVILVILFIIVGIPVSYKLYEMVNEANKEKLTMEAKTGLNIIFQLERSYYTQKGFYMRCKDDADLGLLGYTPIPNARYKYKVDTLGDSFLITAEGNIDNDPDLDVWTLDDYGNLIHLKID